MRAKGIQRDTKLEALGSGRNHDRLGRHDVLHSRSWRSAADQVETEIESGCATG
jgi:hypothetical protein